jgi:hypothetical protein
MLAIQVTVPLFNAGEQMRGGGYYPRAKFGKHFP